MNNVSIFSVSLGLILVTLYIIASWLWPILQDQYDLFICRLKFNSQHEMPKEQIERARDHQIKSDKYYRMFGSLSSDIIGVKGNSVYLDICCNREEGVYKARGSSVAVVKQIVSGYLNNPHLRGFTKYSVNLYTYESYKGAHKEWTPTPAKRWPNPFCEIHLPVKTLFRKDD